MQTSEIFSLQLAFYDRKKIARHMKNHPDHFWIIKPPNLFCGMGIRVINNFKEIPNKKSQLCVQSYIKTPYLINNLKFDLRVYVLVTSVDPLRIYIYKEGLTRYTSFPPRTWILTGLFRFATEDYTTDPEVISNNFIHLTNFSINKESGNFINNSNPEEPEVRESCVTTQNVLIVLPRAPSGH